MSHFISPDTIYCTLPEAHSATRRGKRGAASNAQRSSANREEAHSATRRGKRGTASNAQRSSANREEAHSATRRGKRGATSNAQRRAVAKNHRTRRNNRHAE